MLPSRPSCRRCWLKVLRFRRELLAWALLAVSRISIAATLRMGYGADPDLHPPMPSSRSIFPRPSCARFKKLSDGGEGAHVMGHPRCLARDCPWDVVQWGPMNGQICVGTMLCRFASFCGWDSCSNGAPVLCGLFHGSVCGFSRAAVIGQRVCTAAPLPVQQGRAYVFMAGSDEEGKITSKAIDGSGRCSVWQKLFGAHVLCVLCGTPDECRRMTRSGKGKLSMLNG